MQDGWWNTYALLSRGPYELLISRGAWLGLLNKKVSALYTLSRREPPGPNLFLVTDNSPYG